jgi:hypothetical protein
MTATATVITAIGYLKQWMFDPYHDHHLLLPNAQFTGPADRNHTLINQRTGKFLQGIGATVNWTKDARHRTATKAARWFFTRATDNQSPLRYGEPVALGYGTSRSYIHCLQRTAGVTLAWSEQPEFEWELLGAKSDQPARSGDWIAIYNRRTGDCLTYFDDVVGGDISWPSRHTWPTQPYDPILTAVHQHWDDALTWLLAAGPMSDQASQPVSETR